jgi:tetratricopeptide (TPR) repeat protein
MRKIDKALLKERDEIIANIRAKREKLDAAIEAYNEAAAKAWGEVEDALQAYNETLDPAREWVAGITGDIDVYVSERSEKWQEGEKAEAYESWKGDYESADSSLEEVSIEQPDQIEADIEDHAQILYDLPEEPSL